MHGTIFFFLQRFVEEALGPDGWAKLFEQAGMPIKTYSPATAHPDEDIFALVKAACALTGNSPPEILEAFGKHLSGELLAMYPHLIKPEWRTLDVVSNTEQVIHTVVRAKNPDATPPVLRVQRVSDNQAHLVYASPRHLCALAKGIVSGLSTHFGERIKIAEEACMLEGDPFCSIAFTKVGEAETQQVARSNTVLVQSPVSVWDEPSDVEKPTALAASPEREGGQWLGDYRLVQLLGRGGMGEVYLAEDRTLNREVAIKVMLEDESSNVARERFVREARSMAAIEHDHVVDIYNVGESDGRPYMVMPRLKGTTLADWLADGNRTSVRQALRIGFQTLAGLHAAHRNGLLHRDIKPGNIWLEAPKGKVKLMDFGLCRPLEEESELTVQGAVFGTPSYMPPESFSGSFDVRSDLYSFGVVLYELLTGEKMYSGNTMQDVLLKVVTFVPQPPAETVPGVSPLIDDLVMQLTDKDPSNRPDNAEDVMRTIREELLTVKSD